jgi:hypothetical protein
LGLGERRLQGCEFALPPHERRATAAKAVLERTCRRFAGRLQVSEPYWRCEPIPPLRDRNDETARPRSASKGLSHFSDAGWNSGGAESHDAPDLGNQLVLRHRSIAMADQIGEDIECARPNRHQLAFAAEFEALEINLEFLEGKHRHGAPPVAVQSAGDPTRVGIWMRDLNTRRKKVYGRNRECRSESDAKVAE